MFSRSGSMMPSRRYVPARAGAGVEGLAGFAAGVSFVATTPGVGAGSLATRGAAGSERGGCAASAVCERLQPTKVNIAAGNNLANIPREMRNEGEPKNVRCIVGRSVRTGIPQWTGRVAGKVERTIDAAMARRPSTLHARIFPHARPNSLMPPKVPPDTKHRSACRTPHSAVRRGTGDLVHPVDPTQASARRQT